MINLSAGSMPSDRSACVSYGCTRRSVSTISTSPTTNTAVRPIATGSPVPIGPALT